MSHVKFLAAAGIAVCLAGSLVLAQGELAPLSPHPVSIEIAGAIPNVVSLQTDGAWPLTIRMLAKKPLGIGTYIAPFQYPVDTQQAFIVFADPDGCFSLAKNAPCTAMDETYLEFTPAINLANLRQQDVGGVPAVRLGATLTLNGFTQGHPNNDYPAPVGPVAGTNSNNATVCDENGTDGVCDNYGYGASPNVPGLVILSDTGVGLVWETDASTNVSSLVQPRRARNLAGFVNSVAWTVNEHIGWKTSSVTAHVNVPRRLFSPIAQLDLGWTNDGVTTGRWYRIDFGPWVEDNSFLLRTVLNQVVTTVRMFVISGRAPDTLTDMNGDGVVTAQDAVLAGYNLLSGEEVLQFRTYHQSVTVGQSDLAILFDYDGNGMQGDIAPGGGGGMTPVPR